MTDEQEKILLIADTIDPGHKLDWLWQTCKRLCNRNSDGRVFSRWLEKGGRWVECHCCCDGYSHIAHIDSTNILDVEAWFFGNENLRTIKMLVGPHVGSSCADIAMRWNNFFNEEYVSARVQGSINIIASAIAASKENDE